MYMNACANKSTAATNAAYCRPAMFLAPLIFANAADVADRMHDCVPTEVNDRQSRLPAVLPGSGVPLPPKIVLSRMIAVPT
jgi:hypothetical protein